MRRFNDAHQCPIGQTFDVAFCPIFSIILRNVHKTVVRTCPKNALFHRRFRKSEDVGEGFRTRIVFCNNTTRRLRGVRIVPRQIGRNDFPRRPIIRRFVDKLRRCINRFRVVRRKNNRKSPLKTEFHCLRSITQILNRIRGNVLFLPIFQVPTLQLPHIIAAKNDVRIRRVAHDVARFTRTRNFPIVARQTCPLSISAQNPNRGIVLLCAVKMIRKRIVNRNMIELARRQIQFRPRSAAIVGHFRAAVVAKNHVFRIFRINPQIVRVAVSNLRGIKGFTAVSRCHKIDIQGVNHVNILRVRYNLHIIPWTLPYIFIVTRSRPSFAAVIASEQAAVFIFNNRPNAVAVHRRDRNAHFSKQTNG